MLTFPSSKSRILLEIMKAKCNTNEKVIFDFVLNVHAMVYTYVISQVVVIYLYLYSLGYYYNNFSTCSCIVYTNFENINRRVMPALIAAVKITIHIEGLWWYIYLIQVWQPAKISSITYE